MKIDMKPYFEQYEALVAKVDTAFERVRERYPQEVCCRLGCSDCCHALFDLSLIEAMYIHTRFFEKMTEDQKTAVLEKANRIDRQLARIKRDAAKSLAEGTPEATVLERLAEMRVPCPLLNEEGQCELYASRPITCRLYGVPTAIDGRGHTCGRSGFEPGKSYPTVYLDLIHARLQEISATLLRDAGSPNIKLADLLVPLSMALLTNYDDAYLGLESKSAEDEDKGNRS